MIESLSGRELRLKITMLGSCLGEKKFRQGTFMAVVIQLARILHLSRSCPVELPGSSLPSLICRR